MHGAPLTSFLTRSSPGMPLDTSIRPMRSVQFVALMASLMLALPLLAAITRLMAAPPAQGAVAPRSSIQARHVLPLESLIPPQRAPQGTGITQQLGQDEVSSVDSRTCPGAQPQPHQSRTAIGHEVFYWDEAKAVKVTVRSGSWCMACVLAFGMYASGVAGTIKVVGEFVGLHASLKMLQVGSRLKSIVTVHGYSCGT